MEFKTHLVVVRTCQICRLCRLTFIFLFHVVFSDDFLLRFWKFLITFFKSMQGIEKKSTNIHQHELVKTSVTWKFYYLWALPPSVPCNKPMICLWCSSRRGSAVRWLVEAAGCRRKTCSCATAPGRGACLREGLCSWPKVWGKLQKASNYLKPLCFAAVSSVEPTTT